VLSQSPHSAPCCPNGPSGAPSGTKKVKKEKGTKTPQTKNFGNSLLERFGGRVDMQSANACAIQKPKEQFVQPTFEHGISGREPGTPCRRGGTKKHPETPKLTQANPESTQWPPKTEGHRQGHCGEQRSVSPQPAHNRRRGAKYYTRFQVAWESTCLPAHIAATFHTIWKPGKQIVKNISKIVWQSCT